MKTLKLTAVNKLLGVEVEGAGAIQANGYYPTADTKVFGKLAFVKEDGTGWQIAFTIAPEDTWLMADGFSPMYEAPQPNVIPPENGWLTVLGSSPAPTIKYVYDPVPMYDLSLDALGNLAIATGAEGLRQKLETRFRLYLGEWFLDVDKGVPYVQRIMGRAQGSNPALQNTIGQILDSQALKEPEVLSVISSSSEFNRETRDYTYNAQLETVYGQLTLEV